METRDAKQPLFLDTNVLIYASIKEAPEYLIVRGFVEKQLALGTPLFISRQVLREYLSVLSRPQSNCDPILPATLLIWLAAWRDRCQVLDDNGAVMEILWSLFAATPFGGKLVHDANIVATMLRSSIMAAMTSVSTKQLSNELLLSFASLNFNNDRFKVTSLPGW